MVAMQSGSWLDRNDKDRMDYTLEQWIIAPAGHTPWLDTLARLVAGWSEPAFIALIMGWFLLGWWRGLPRERQGAITALLAAGTGLAINQGIGRLWNRPRPFVSHPGSVHLLMTHGRDGSFPSDHAVAAFAIATVLACYHWRLGIATILLAAGVCLARVYAGVHYPGDVLAGALIGTVVALVLVRGLGNGMERLRIVGDRIIVGLHLPLPA